MSIKNNNKYDRDKHGRRIKKITMPTLEDYARAEARKKIELYEEDLILKQMHDIDCYWKL